MKKLRIIAEESSLKLQELSNAVYKILNQKEDITAEIIFVDKEEIHSLNNRFRNVDRVTDVLSFPTLDNIRGKVLNKKDYLNDLTEDGKSIFIGSIAICLDVAKEQAVEFGHSTEREIMYLLCHGLLHLFGYDHMTDEDKTEMRGLEDKIMDLIKIYR